MIGVPGLEKQLPWLAGLILLCAPATGQTVGYAHAEGTVYRLDLDPGGGDVVWQVASETDLGGRTGAFARSADGRLFGTSSWWPNDNRLYLIEPATGDVDFVGPIVSGLWVDLAFDNQERLWMALDGDLHLVDASDATATLVTLDRDDLLAVSSHAGMLFGIAGEGFLESFQLIEIDPDSGTSQIVAELSGYTQLGCYNESPTSMAFDVDGGLWVVVAEWHGTCIIPFPSTGYQYYSDPPSGIPGPRRHLAPGAPDTMPGLAVLGGPVVVDIPTLSPVGAAGLAALAVVAGLTMLRRQRRPRESSPRDGDP